MKYRILIATPFLSEKPIKGYENIVLTMIDDFIDKNHKVDVVTFNSDGSRKINNVFFLNRLNNLFVIRINKLQRLLNVCIGFFIGESIQISYFRGNHKDERRILDKIQSGNYDLVISITTRMARFLTYNINNSFKVLHLIDPHVLNYSRSIKWEGFFTKLIFKFDLPRLFKFEKQVFDKFHFRTLISDEDISEMSLLYGMEFRKLTYGSRNIKSHGVYLDFKNRDRNKIVITGNLGYNPNVVGVEYFCKYVFPYILKFHPDVKLYLIGANPPPKLLKWESNNIIFTGYVENMFTFMSDAFVSICPINHRIGVQTKVLEAFSQNIPVISTRNANSGINANVDNEILVADTPEEFLNKYEFLLIQKNWEKISKNAFNLFLNKYNLIRNIEDMNSCIFESVLKFKSL